MICISPHDITIAKDKTMTLTTDVKNVPVIVGGCYTIDEKMANTYIHEDMANTLAARDYKQPQVVIVIEGNGQRPSHRGDGYCESNVMYTLNSTEVHGICYEAKRNNKE